MSGRWWRAYDDALHDPKVQALPPVLFKFWFNLLCVASKNDGVIPPLSELKAILKARLDYLEDHIQDLLKRGLLDECEGRIEPHNWRKRQYKSDNSTPRVQEHRKGKRNVSETPPDTETDNRDREEKKEARELALVVDDGWPVDFRDQFWGRYPNKVGKPKALAKLEGARKRGVPFVEIMTGLDRYIASKPPDRAWLNPETFINQERWNDQPAPVAQQGSYGKAQHKPGVVEIAKRHAEFFESQSGDGFEGNSGALLRLPQR